MRDIDDIGDVGKKGHVIIALHEHHLLGARFERCPFPAVPAKVSTKVRHHPELIFDGREVFPAPRSKQLHHKLYDPFGGGLLCSVLGMAEGLRNERV